MDRKMCEKNRSNALAKFKKDIFDELIGID